jgi:hypothetical protein
LRIRICFGGLKNYGDTLYIIKEVLYIEKNKIES